MKHLIDPMDLSVEEINQLLELGDDIILHKEKYQDVCRHKKLATLFFEPSTRTRLSFEAAMMELGGNVLGFSSADSSSAKKGESVSDTVRVVAGYADIIAMRHPKEGAPFAASRKVNVPIINAGDGGHNHPTQTLTDLMTIRCEKGCPDNLTIGFCGDLKYGRTVHSLIAALSRYKNVHAVLISPDELRVPDYIRRETLADSDMTLFETRSLEEALPKLDILYMTRIQRERFSDKNEYERLKNSYIITPESLKTAKKDLCILHPLPRVNEISVSVDKDPRACYFKQVLYGKYIRMALILKLLNGVKSESETDRDGNGEELLRNVFFCQNPRCITSSEQELDHLFVPKKGGHGIYRCLYCEKKGVLQ